MTKGEQTRKKIVAAAAPIFNRRGYEGSSLAELMEATGLQKGGIYRHFSSKEELAAEAFDYTWGRAAAMRLDGLEAIPDSVGRLKKMIGNFVERRPGLIPGGCPLMNTAVESDDGNVLLRSRARQALQAWTTRLSRIIAVGIAVGQINPHLDPRELSQLIIGSLEGALFLRRLQNSPKPLLTVQRHLEHHLETSVRTKSPRPS